MCYQTRTTGKRRAVATLALLMAIVGPSSSETAETAARLGRAEAASVQPATLLPTETWSEGPVDEPVIADGRGEHRSSGAGWFDRLPLTLANRADNPPRPFGSWGATAALAATSLAIRQTLDGPEDPRWRGGILFDDSVRDALRGGSADSRNAAADVSDILRGTLWAWVLADTAMIRGWDNQREVWRINLDAALEQALSEGLVKHASGRQRPDLSDNRSFFSGHTSSAATAAGLICAHHLHGDLYGGGNGDAAACAGAAAAAFATGVARIIADKHYSTDVLAGWAVGALYGYYLPSRWYYRPEDEESEVQAVVTPSVGLGTYGVVCSVRW